MFNFRSEFIREGGTLRTVKIRQLVAAVGEDERKEQVSEVNVIIYFLKITYHKLTFPRNGDYK